MASGPVQFGLINWSARSINGRTQLRTMIFCICKMTATNNRCCPQNIPSHFLQRGLCNHDTFSNCSQHLYNYRKSRPLTLLCGTNLFPSATNFYACQLNSHTTPLACVQSQSAHNVHLPAIDIDPC
jgi:hypothetical protein